MSDLPIALSTGPSTRICCDIIGRILGERGREVRMYEADGRGGREMEANVLAGRISAVLDVTLTELAAEMLGLPGGAGRDRLTAAALRGVPQIIALGGLDAIPASGGRQPPGSTAQNQGANAPRSPGDYRSISAGDHDALGQEIANKASAARGPTTILIPLRDASPVLVRSLTNWIGPSVRVRELNLHVNDPAFAMAMIESLPIEWQP